MDVLLWGLKASPGARSSFMEIYIANFDLKKLVFNSKIWQFCIENHADLKPDTRCKKTGKRM